MRKKIAFIGCSHFAAFETGAGQGTDSWTWQLAQLYPGHIYRNYSVGGRGIEYYQWCIMHAKAWGADIVFLNRTYTGRWSIMGEYDEFANKDFVNDWKIVTHTSNWDEAYLDVAHAWGSGGRYNINGHVADHISKPLNAAMQTITETWATTELRRSYENQWYRMAIANLYNFDHVFLVDWAGADDIISNIRTDTSVVDMFLARFNIKKELDLWKFGITRAPDDNHLSHKGHNILLNDYILSSKQVIAALTQ
jgi:hypothetical protein